MLFLKFERSEYNLIASFLQRIPQHHEVIRNFSIKFAVGIDRFH